MSSLPNPRSLVASLALCLSVACVQTVGRGPDLGACAEIPDGVYGFGEVGIGSCLAGPADVAFVQRSGRDWLAVSNADPFINFDSGSVLFIDWESVEAGIARGEEILYTSDLVTLPVETERFVGAMGVLEDRDLLMVAQRFTEGARTRAGDDDARVIDLATGAPWDGGERVALRDDPGDFVVDADNGLAYALNFTDHSVSVLDVSAGPIVTIDLAPEAEIVELPFEDRDDSGSVAELDRLLITVPGDVPTDLWSMDWLPGTVRVYVPDGDALARWTSGGGPYVPDVLGDNVDLALPIRDAAIALPSVRSQHDSTLADIGIYYAVDGLIRYAENTGDIDGWSEGQGFVLGGRTDTWQERLSGPSLAVVDGVPALFFAGTTEDDPTTASIGFALANEAGRFVSPDLPALVPDPGESYEQPFAQFDGQSFSGRVWFSHWDGTRYQIGHSTFDDQSKEGLAFTPVTTALGLDGESIGAPVVRYFDGRYQLWAARDDGTHWTHITASSPDGLRWSDPIDLFESPVEYDARRPPRVAVAHQSAAYWRLSGRDLGLDDLPVLNGTRLVDFDNGFSISVANGHLFSADALFPLGRAAQGIAPTSHVAFGDHERLYVTITGDDGRDRIAVLDNATGPWDVLAQDLLPQGVGGNVAGASKPVVHEVPDGYVMYYVAQGTGGVTRIRAATSPDGIRFTPVGEDLLPELAEWTVAEQEPHSIEVDEEGVTTLWISGNDGSRWRIGAVTIGDPTDPANSSYTLEPLEFTDFQLASGLPGGADDSGVKDPVVVMADGERVLFYAGFDGLRWSLCRAVFAGGEWRRREDRTVGGTLPAMDAEFGTFTTGGADSPVIVPADDGTLTVYFAGYDANDGPDTIRRIGNAVGRGPTIYPDYHQPTFGDTLGFETQAGSERADVIELAQVTDTFGLTGTGTTSLIHDPDAGMLYVPSKLSNLLYVVDVRDDVRVGRPDANARDLETVVRLTTVQNFSGFRGGALDADRRRLYLTTRSPEGIAVLDLDAVVDDDDKEVTEGAFIGTLPLRDDRRDRGAESVASIGGAEPLLVGDLLIVPNFKDNSISVFDMSIGTFGAEVAYIPFVGENPHVTAVSPDGRWVVVANYLGDLDDNLASSTLALVDLDPASPTYLTVPHWIKNR